MSRLGKNIRHIRQTQGVSIRTLAPRVPLDHSYLSRIESGEQEADKVSWGIITGLAKALGVSVGSLIEDGAAPRDHMSEEERRLIAAYRKIKDSARKRSINETLGLTPRRNARRSR